MAFSPAAIATVSRYLKRNPTLSNVVVETQGSNMMVRLQSPDGGSEPVGTVQFDQRRRQRFLAESATEGYPKSYHRRLVDALDILTTALRGA